MQIIAAEETIESLARVLVNRTLYGTSHPITRRTFDQAWDRLRAFLADTPELTINLAEDRLLLQGQVVDRPRATTRLLTERLEKHSVHGITFTRSCNAEGIDRLCELLDLPSRENSDAPFGMLAERLAKAGVQGITIEKAVFKRVSEPKEEPDKVSASAKETPTPESEWVDFFSRFRSEPAPAEPKNVPPAPPSAPASKSAGAGRPNAKAESAPATVKEMAEFLDGKESRPADNALKNAGSGREKDISAMITLLIAAMMMKRKENDLDPQSFADSFLGSLKNTYQAIRENAPQGGRHAPEAIRKINSGMVEWMDSPQAGVLPEDTAKRSREIADEVATQAEISAAYNAYVSSRKKFQRAEGQWQSVKTRYGDEKILAAGLSPAAGGNGHHPVPEGIGVPAVPAGAPPSPLQETQPPEDLALQAMLSSLRFSADDEGSSVDYPREIEKLREQIDQLIESTTQKIEVLLEKTEKLKNAENATNSTSPKELLDRLSEAVQELLQPLSVVTCSLDILGGPRSEKLNESNRRNTIDLALENSRRIETLIEKLGAVSGLPDDLYPHPEII